MKTPFAILEEHHEAFAAWALARQEGIIGSRNMLFHFDDHSDLRSPLLNTSIKEVLEMDLQGIASFTHRELNIDSFIIPAIYNDTIDNLVWIRRDMPKKGNFRMYLRSYNQEGRKFFSDKYTTNTTPDHFKFYDYIKTDLAGFQDSQWPDKDFLLDIDLDYFSCCESPNKEVVLETTKAEYEEFNTNKYHPLNYTSSTVNSLQYKDSYFFIFNHTKYDYPSPREIKEEEIASQINKLTNALASSGIQPKLITICRSRHSGFTPEHQWKMIENKLLDRLDQLYHLDKINLNL